LITKQVEIEEMLGSWEQALRLNRLGLKYQEKIAVHINLDSGMGRSGFYFKRETERKQLLDLPELPGIKVVGIMSHFPRAEEQKLTRTKEALTRFKAAVAYLREHNSSYKNTLVHAASSALGIRVPESHLDMARFGALIYVSRLSKHVPLIEGIKAVMSWKTRVIKVSKVEAGASLGYGAYRTDRPTRIATLPVGYGDGYPRELSNKGYVLIQGEKCPVVGSICLNTMTVKVPKKVTLGDEVVLLGCQEDNCIKAEELAAQFDSVHTEVQLAGVFNQRKEE
ncbi:MAG: alanine racemase, partial [Halanaerobacter sp.]